VEADIRDPVVNGYASGVKGAQLWIDSVEKKDVGGYITWSGGVGHLDYPATGQTIVLKVEDNAGNVTVRQW
jgi:hypothetical protein